MTTAEEILKTSLWQGWDDNSTVTEAGANMVLLKYCTGVIWHRMHGALFTR